uniref:cell wall integrity and stress response component 3-like isoform X9 n=1 Tax=Gasterosteus aculeatus aculeatus TaxID=481459 RepID=UPI001A98593D|nr:cell wall integrity and stress response component 3-like isoform X9 [Gasterosteus aculeatus aculeatus]
MLQFTEAATEQRLTVRDGDEVTLPCNSVTEDQNNCDSTEWFFINSKNTSAVDLVTNGQIEEAKAESDRLSVSQNCCLVMKKVTRGDVGRYICRQFRPGRQHKDAEVYLSVVFMTEETNRAEVTLRCSVWTYDRCPRTVKWMNGGQDVDKDKEVKTSPSLCSASLSFKTSHFFYTSSFTSLKCEVTDRDKVMQFSPSGDDTTTTTTTEEDTKAGDTTTTSAIREASAEPQSADTTTTTTSESTTIKEGTKAGDTTTTSTISDASTEPQSGWRLVSVSVGLAALIIILVVVNMWIRIKERKTQTEENAVRYDAEDDTVNYENMRPAAGV